MVEQCAAYSPLSGPGMPQQTHYRHFCPFELSLIKGRLVIAHAVKPNYSEWKDPRERSPKDYHSIYIRLFYLGGIDGWSAGISWHAQTYFPSNDCNTGKG